jgi:hypothetical protein
MISAFVLLLILPNNAYAVADKVYVGGVLLNNNESAKVNFNEPVIKSETYSEEDEVYFKDGVLTLNGAYITTGNYNDNIIYATDDLTINIAKNGLLSGSRMGVVVVGDNKKVTFCGENTMLSINCSDANNDVSYGIFARGGAIFNGSIIVNCFSGKGNTSAGIMVFPFAESGTNGIVLNDTAVVNVVARESLQSQSVGIYLKNGNLTVKENAKLTSKGGTPASHFTDNPNYGSFGIQFAIDNYMYNSCQINYEGIVEASGYDRALIGSFNWGLPVDASKSVGSLNYDGSNHEPLTTENYYSKVYKYINFNGVSYYPLFIGNTQVSNINKDNVLGDGKVVFNSETNTLELNSASINHGGDDNYGWGINYRGDDNFEIVTNGSNSITPARDTVKVSAGILIGKPEGIVSNYSPNVTITVNSGSSLISIANQVTGTFDIVSAGVLNRSRGVFTLAGNGTANFNGGACNSQASSTESYGIYTRGNLVLNKKSMMLCQGGNGATYSDGIYANNITMDTNEPHVPIMAHGGKAAYSNGIEASNLTLNSGYLIGSGKDGTNRSYGIYVVNNFNINGGIVQAYTNSTVEDKIKQALYNIPQLGDGIVAYGNENATNNDGRVVYKSENNNKYIYFTSKVMEYIFPDVPEGKWYSDGIQYVKNNNLMSGYSGGDKDGLFGPDDLIKRGQIATILYRLAGSPYGETDENTDLVSTFPDVQNKKSYYYKAVIWANEKGIVTGYTSGANKGKFGPNDYIKRQDLAVMLGRYAKLVANIDTTTEYSLDTFRDNNSVSSYAKENTYIQFIVENGVITGKERTNGDDNYVLLAPKDTAKRSETATMLMRFIKNVLP